MRLSGAVHYRSDLIRLRHPQRRKPHVLFCYWSIQTSPVLPAPYEPGVPVPVVVGRVRPLGAVMLWAMAAVLGAFTFQETGLTVRWFLAYLVLTIASSILEGGRIDQLDNSEQVKRCRDLLQTTHVGTVESSAPITGLVDNLRRFAKLDDAPRQNVDLHEGIDSAPASADLAPSGERRTTPIGGASGSR